MSFTTIIFDMDGLMVDTEPLARAAWDAALAPFGHVVSDDLYTRMIGWRTLESAQMVLDDFPGLGLTRDEIIARKTAAFLQILERGVPVMPGLYDLLDAIERRDLPWGIATSTPRVLAENILGKLGVLSRLRALATGDEVIHGKPAPDLYLLAAARLGADPTRCLALEDTPIGCRAGAAAGLRVVAVPSEGNDPAAFTCAYRVLNSLVEVEAGLDGLLI